MYSLLSDNLLLRRGSFWAPEHLESEMLLVILHVKVLSAVLV